MQRFCRALAGKLLCRQEPVVGKSPAATASNPYDEKGYIAIPPCLYGPESEGLYPPIYLTYDTNLTSIKKNNNTYGHLGEMASEFCSHAEERWRTWGLFFNVVVTLCSPFYFTLTSSHRRPFFSSFFVAVWQMRGYQAFE
jgi:hypothetical protein